MVRSRTYVILHGTSSGSINVMASLWRFNPTRLEFDRAYGLFADRSDNPLVQGLVRRCAGILHKPFLCRESGVQASVA